MKLKVVKGQILIVTFFLLIIVAILTWGLLHMWESGVKHPLLREHSLRAFYLAQAGIERAKIEVLNNVNLNGCQPGPTCDNHWFIDLDDVADSNTWNYRFEVTGAASATQRIITGVGQVLDKNGNEVARRVIEVTVDNIDDQLPSGLPDGIDDDSSGILLIWGEI